MKRTAKITTVRDTFTRMLEEKQAQGLSRPTLSNYTISLQVFLTDNGLDDQADVSIFTKELVVNWVNQQLETRKPVTVNHYLRELRVYIYYLQDNEFIPAYRLSTVKSQERAIKGYTEAELKQLLVKPSHTDTFPVWRSWAIVNLMLATGARAGSVCTLTKSNVDFDNHLITFSHTKSKRFLQVPMTDSLKSALKAYLAEWDINSDLVFPTVTGTQCLSHGLLQAFMDYCSYRGVKSQGLHTLRHSFARLAIQNGMDVFTLQKILGHSDIKQTIGYVNILAQNLSTTSIPLDILQTERKVKRHG